MSVNLYTYHKEYFNINFSSSNDKYQYHIISNFNINGQVNLALSQGLWLKV